MSFNNTLFRELLTLIETRTTFTVSGVKEPQCFDFKCCIDIEELFSTMNKTSERYKMEEFKYCIALLRQFDYIKISNGSIIGFTQNGYKFLLSTLHNIECKY